MIFRYKHTLHHDINIIIIIIIIVISTGPEHGRIVSRERERGAGHKETERVCNTMLGQLGCIWIIIITILNVILIIITIINVILISIIIIIKMCWSRATLLYCTLLSVMMRMVVMVMLWLHGIHNPVHYKTLFSKKYSTPKIQQNTSNSL